MIIMVDGTPTAVKRNVQYEECTTNDALTYLNNYEHDSDNVAALDSMRDYIRRNSSLRYFLNTSYVTCEDMLVVYRGIILMYAAKGQEFGIPTYEEFATNAFVSVHCLANYPSDNIVARDAMSEQYTSEVRRNPLSYREFKCSKCGRTMYNARSQDQWAQSHGLPMINACAFCISAIKEKRGLIGID